jgi:hypothetical protein
VHTAGLKYLAIIESGLAIALVQGCLTRRGGDGGLPICSGISSCTRPSAFEGVWREDRILVTRRDGSLITVRPEASIYVVTGAYYSMMATFGVRPRPVFKSLVPTDSEKIVAFDTFWGHSGRYELAGDTITLHPIVAKSPNLMAGGFQKFRLRASADTLWLSGRFRNYYFRVGDRLVADSLNWFVAEEIQLVRMPPG